MEYTFKAERRPKKIRNISRKAIAGNFIPAVVYNKDENIPITLNRHDFEKAMPKLRSNTIFKLDLGDEAFSVFIRAHSYDVKSHRMEHLDFYKLSSERPVVIKIPIELEGLAIGLTKGGLIRRHHTSLTIKTLPKHIPTAITLDIAELDINDVIFVRDLLKRTEFKEAPYKILSSPAQSIVSVTISSRAASGSAQAKGEKTTTSAPAAGDAKKDTA